MKRAPLIAVALFSFSTGGLPHLFVGARAICIEDRTRFFKQRFAIGVHFVPDGAVQFDVEADELLILKILKRRVSRVDADALGAFRRRGRC